MQQALIIIHMQEDIVMPGTAFGQLFSEQVQSRNLIEVVNQAAMKARQRGEVVVWARIAFDAEHPVNPTMPLLDAVAATNSLQEHTSGAAIVCDVEPEDVVITHRRPGPFFGTDLAQQLRQRGVEAVTVCGVATNASVEAAVRQAADEGFEVHLLESACAAADMQTHEASVQSMEALFLRSVQRNGG